MRLKDNRELTFIALKITNSPGANLDAYAPAEPATGRRRSICTDQKIKFGQAGNLGTSETRQKPSDSGLVVRTADSISDARKTRQERAKKRSLHKVSEHFEQVSNAVIWFVGRSQCIPGGSCPFIDRIILAMPPPFIFFIIFCIWVNCFNNRFTS